MREGKQKASGDTAVDEAIPRTRLVDARPFLLLETLGWMPGAGAAATDAPQQWCLAEIRFRLLKMQQQQPKSAPVAAASFADMVRKMTAVASRHIAAVGANAAREIVELLLKAAKESAKAISLESSALDPSFTNAVIESYGPACSPLSTSAKTALWMLEPALLHDVVYRSMLSGADRPFAGLPEISATLVATGVMDACRKQPSLTSAVVAALDGCVRQSEGDLRVLRIANAWVSGILCHTPSLRSKLVSAIAQSFLKVDCNSDGGSGSADALATDQEADGGGSGSGDGGGGGSDGKHANTAVAEFVRVLLGDLPPQLTTSTSAPQSADLAKAEIQLESCVKAAANVGTPSSSSSSWNISALKRLAMHQFNWTETAAHTLILGRGQREHGQDVKEGNEREYDDNDDAHDYDGDYHPKDGDCGAAAVFTGRGGRVASVKRTSKPSAVPPPPAGFRLLCWVFDADVRVPGPFQTLAFALHRALTVEDLVGVVTAAVVAASAPHCSPLGVGSILLLAVTLLSHPAAVEARGELLTTFVRTVLQVQGTVAMVLDMLERHRVQNVGGTNNDSDIASSSSSGSIIGPKDVLLDEIIRQLSAHFQSRYGNKGEHGDGDVVGRSGGGIARRNQIALADGVGRCRRLQNEINSDIDDASEHDETEEVRIPLGFDLIL